MNKEDITRLAREAGFANVRGGLMDNGELSDYWDCWPGQLERFFHLAYAAGADAEREACAQAARTAMLGAEWPLTERVMRAIRARGEK